MNYRLICQIVGCGYRTTNYLKYREVLNHQSPSFQQLKNRATFDFIKLGIMVHRPYTPFKHDKELKKEIPLIRAVAELVIINSAKPIDL